jgi:hypothetical protein
MPAFDSSFIMIDPNCGHLHSFSLYMDQFFMCMDGEQESLPL